MSTSPIGIELLGDTTRDGWLIFNDAVYAMEALTTAKAALSMTVKTDVGLTPSEGDLYIIPTDATGTWAAHVKEIAQRKNGGWTYYTPTYGLVKFVVSENHFAMYHADGGGTWKKSNETWS